MSSENTGPGTAADSDWQVVVRLVAHCRRRYKRECSCRVPGTVMAPGTSEQSGRGPTALAGHE